MRDLLSGSKLLFIDKRRLTIWQKWNGAPWHIKTVQFLVVGFAATYLFIIADFDERVAGLAGLIGINAAIFLAIAYMADQDDKKINS